MSERKPIRTDEELGRAIDELLQEFEPETQEEISNSLRQAGYDSAILQQIGRDLATVEAAKSPLHWRNRARQQQSEFEAQSQSIKSRIKKTRKEIEQAISQFVSANPSVVALQHRNLQTMSDEDVTSLWDQIQALASQEDSQDETNQFESWER
jgi:arginine repressor